MKDWLIKNCLDSKGRINSKSSALSEWENMKNHNYNKIYDCGNYVFLLK